MPTPVGIAEKTLLTGGFLRGKVEECEAPQVEIIVLSRRTSVVAVEEARGDRS